MRYRPYKFASPRVKKAENLASSSSSLDFLRIPRLASIRIYTARYASIWLTQPRRHSHWGYRVTVATISEVKGQCSTVNRSKRWFPNLAKPNTHRDGA
jgi:hypothetical protein